MSQTHEGPGASPPTTQRWVKAFGIVVIVLLIVVGIMLLSGGEHGPGRHMPSTSVTQDQIPPTAHSGQQP